MHKILLGEYSVLNIYENFGGGDFSPGKIEFGVDVVRFFFVVRVSIPGVNSGMVNKHSSSSSSDINDACVCTKLDIIPHVAAPAPGRGPLVCDSLLQSVALNITGTNSCCGSTK